MRRILDRIRGSREDGYSLVELLVAMGIFTIILVIFSAAVMGWTRSAVRNSAVSDQTTIARVIFDRLDKQVPAGDSINRPQLVNGNWYVEFQSDAVAPSTCTQWVFRTATGEIGYRTWNTGLPSTPTASPWRILTNDAVLATTDGTNPTTVVPWRVTQPGGDSARQQLLVDFDLRQGTGPLTEVSPTLVLRNSGASSTTVADANNDGVSDAQVCLDIPTPRP